ncbi:uncharacterized protein PV06_04458 [Exophiala oligosperma]|uniref:Uncharacterized protein n=1 Tax=Exophiala oligosperma TaxID=215243 RepID=A0A0D2AU50_9EURO|nr:uncharacterized protein PV06_04458 [Exophiala oligosperma]KIW43346.1 hypothetical protein PV06_04458 [Exophiala oligosperma]
MVMGMNEHEGDPPDQTSTFTPELYLGVTLLRRAGALRLADTFAGQGAVDGVPVLLRLLEVTPAPVSGHQGHQDHVGPAQTRTFNNHVRADKHDRQEIKDES